MNDRFPQADKRLPMLFMPDARQLLAATFLAAAFLVAGGGAAQAQDSPPVTAADHARQDPFDDNKTATNAAHHWRYTVGLKLKSSDQTDGSKSLVLRPVLGLRYGRWRLGYATGDEWLKFSGYRKETNVSYELRDNDKLNIALSARVQNLQDNESFDGFSSGRNTLRGRVSVGYRLNNRWSIGSDVTQDLMNRGDGTTVSMGLSYLWPLSDYSALSLSGGGTWATGNHWATQWRTGPVPQGGWHAGLGELGVGMSYRYAITDQWAWYGTLGSSRHLNQVNEISPTSMRWNGQIGLLYFSR